MTERLVSWAVATKWAVREPGDATSVIETHRGAVCGVIVDVQGSGDGAGTLAWSLVALALQSAGEGASAVGIATAVNRALWTRRRGRVQAGVGVVIVERARVVSFASFGTVVVAALHPLCRFLSDAEPAPAGIDRDAAPSVGRLDGADGALLMFSDGVAESEEDLRGLLGDDDPRHLTADDVLLRAMARDKGRPKNDMSVIVVSEAKLDGGLPMRTAGQLTLVDPSHRAGPGNADG